jgi:hypothetical protein
VIVAAELTGICQRAQMDAVLYGGARQHRARLAEIVAARLAPAAA